MNASFSRRESGRHNKATEIHEGVRMSRKYATEHFFILVVRHNGRDKLAHLCANVDAAHVQIFCVGHPINTLNARDLQPRFIERVASGCLRLWLLLLLLLLLCLLLLFLIGLGGVGSSRRGSCCSCGCGCRSSNSRRCGRCGLRGRFQRRDDPRERSLKSKECE